MNVSTEIKFTNLIITRSVPSNSQTLRSCDCGPEGCNAAEMYADQYRDHLMTLCPGGKGLAGFIGEGMGGMTAAMMQPKG